jgi:hypothetical protein
MVWIPNKRISLISNLRRKNAAIEEGKSQATGEAFL